MVIVDRNERATSLAVAAAAAAASGPASSGGRASTTHAAGALDRLVSPSDSTLVDARQLHDIGLVVPNARNGNV